MELPTFDTRRFWARPILGQDTTAYPQPGSLLLHALEVQFLASPERSRRLLVLQPRSRLSFDDTLYHRRDLQWAQRCFVCGFLFICDRVSWDADRMRCRVDELVEQAEREFGGFDAVVLYHAYPRISADERNQFDFWRDMPGDVMGVRRGVERFHQHGVRVFIPYLPRDIGTHREPQSDAAVLAEMVARVGADGIFLDTMAEAPVRLRETVDSKRRGVVFEPEGHPAIEERERCNASWAQWLQTFEGMGVLHLKWIEPRHMQYQICCWDTDHTQELAAAWLSGSGILVWENIFRFAEPLAMGRPRSVTQYGPHMACDRRPASPHGEWLPCAPVSTDGVLAPCWRRKQRWLWTFTGGEQAVTLPVPPVLRAQRWRW